MTTTFESFGLDSELLEAISSMGFETPTEIQSQAIPKILKSAQDLIALAQTGTGKTGAFALPCLQKLNPETPEPQILILAPTRELALQTAKEIKKFSKNKGYVKSVALYGGGDLRSQARSLAKGCQVVVGTPGRTLDFIRQRRLDLSMISMVILDEADEMLKMGFQEDLESILSETPKDKQTLLFSATMPKQIERIAKKYMNNPEKISIGERNSGNQDVSHSYIFVHRDDRLRALARLVDFLPDMYGIIFCRTRNETAEVTAQLRADGYPVDVLNGELSQGQRDRVMGQFRRGHLKILVATDVAARGLDVDDLTHIINFNLPDELEVYVHRSGRTGRAGKEGQAISLVTKSSQDRIRNLEKMIKAEFTQKQIPSGMEIVEAQLKYSLEQIDSIDISPELKTQFAPLISEKLAVYSAEELQQKILALLCGTIWKTYQAAPDLNENLAKKDRSKKKKKKDRTKNKELDKPKSKKEERPYNAGNFVMCEINLGAREGLNPHRLMGLINENFEGKKPDFGRISIGKKKTFFGIEQDAFSRLLQVMKGVEWGGKKVFVSKMD